MDAVALCDVKTLNGLNVRLVFEDGTQKDINLAALLQGGNLEALRSDEAAFQTAKVQDGNLVWANGAMLSAQTLYDF